MEDILSVTSTTNMICIGDRQNRHQATVIIPAQAAANKPGVLDIQSVSGTTVTDVYLWPTSTNTFRYGTTWPTTPDSDGAEFAAGASTTLNNLGTTAINAALIPGAATIDLGTDANPFRTEHLLTSLILNQTTGNYTVTWADPGAGRALSITDPGATATFMLDAGAANAISYTKGTSTIVMAANSDIDMATGVTMNLDTNLTTNTEAITLNQSLSTTDDVQFGAITSTTTSAGTLALAAASITDSSGAISFGNENLTTTGTINVASDNINLTLGASGATDSRIFFDGAGNLMFYDSNLATSRSLTELYTGTTLNPSVSGNLTITDGNFTWTNTSASETAVFTLAATTVDGIQINSSNTTADVVQITANATNSGTLLSLVSVDATMTSGAYIYCYDGAAQDFAVRRYGATTIAGVASTDVLTVTAGDVQVTAGDIDIDLGIITIDNTADEQNYIKRNNATGTNPMLLLEETHVNGGVTLKVDSKVTDAIDAVQILHAGPAFGLSVTGTSTTGTQATFIGPASQTTSSVIIDGTTGSWIGAAATGLLHVSSDGVLAADSSSLIYATYTGNAGGTSLYGSCAYLFDAGATSGETYAAFIQSTSNNALRCGVSTTSRTTLLVEGPSAQTAKMVYLNGTATNGWGGAADTGMLHLALDGNTLATTASAIQIAIGAGTPTDASLGYALRIADTTVAPATPASTYAVWASTTCNSVYLATTNAAATALTLSGPQAQTASMLKLDPTTGTGWVGAANVGLIHVAHDTALADVAASQVYLASSDAIDDSRGHCLRIVDSSNVDGTMGYPVSITSNDATMGGIIVTTHASGTALSCVGGKATFAGGLTTKVATTDTANPPTNAEMITAFGAAATTGAGFVGIIDDANGHANEYLVWSDGTKYWYVAGTAGA